MTSTVKIKGTDYKLIVARLKEFLDDSKGEYAIHTEVLKADMNEALVKASVIHLATGVVCSTGHAHEVQGSTNVNSTSWVENCETSAIGRCIGMFKSKYTGDSIASADEVANAIQQQNDATPLMEHNEALQRNFASVYFIKEHLALQSWEAVAEAWGEITNDDKKALWLAPSKGGIFTTAERKDLKSDEFNQARKLILGEA